MPLGTSPRIRFILLLTLMAGSIAVTSAAVAQQDASGTWVATVPSTQGTAEETLTLEKSGEEWTGTYKSISRTLEIDKILVVDGRVHFEITPEPKFTGKYDCALDETGNRLSGTVTVNNFPSKPITFIRQINELVDETGVKKYRVGSGPAGQWVGKVRSPDGEDSQVILALEKIDSEWTAFLDDPFANEVRGENVKVTDTMISFTFRPEGAPFPSNFSGTYLAAEDRVTGSFSQRGASRFVKFVRDPSTITLGLGPDGTPILPPRVRHPYKFGLTGRMSYWAPLHVVKDETFNLNTLTTGAINYDGALKFFVLDSFAVFARGFHGGQNFTSDIGKLAPYEEMNLSGDSYLKLDGFEFGVLGFLGPLVTPDSGFNPYLTAAGGRANWELTATGRGSTILIRDDENLTGSDFCVALGFGSEYELKSNVSLEFELLWRFFMTEDTNKWLLPDEGWSNTHAWSLSAGLTYGLF